LDPLSVVWSLVAGACFTLGVVYLMAWLNQVGQREHLAFFVLAASLGCLTLLELAIMRSASPEAAGQAIRWAHVPGATMVLSIVAFLQLYFGSRRLWLGYLACALRLVAVALNFYFEPNLNFSAINHLESITVWGETVFVPVGVPNPWAIVGKLSSLFLLLFALDATIHEWRKGGAIERRRALLIGGSFVLVVVMATGTSVLVHPGLVLPLYVFSVPSLVLMAAVAFELGADMVRALQMSARLQQSEAELRQSEQRMKLAADAASVGVWEWDMRRDRIWASERALALFGIAPHADLGFERFIEALHVDHRPAARNTAEALRAHGGTIEQRVRVVLPDGTNRWLLTRGSTETDASGQPALLRGVTFDITERHRAERRYQRVVEEAPYGLLTADAEGVVDFANASAASIFRYSRDELVGRSLESLMPGCLGGPPCPDVNDATARKGTMPPFRRSVLGRRKDGSEGALEVGLNHIDGPNGAVLLAMVVDVSALKTANEQIERDRAFLRKVIDTIPGLFFAKDRDGRFTLVNQALADLYARPMGELLGKCEADVHAIREEVRRMRADDLDVMDNRRPRVIAEEAITGADGQKRWWTTVKVPIVDASGQAVQVLGSSIDITARKRAQLEVEQQRNELAHLSRVTMLSELSGSLTHELNQPLAAILSNAQAAQRFLAAAEPNLEEVREVLRDIVSDDRRAGEVIRGLRLMLKRGELRHEEFDPNDLVRDVLKLVRGDILNAGVYLTVELAPALPPLSGDRVQLQQVLLNLIVNGCEAMSSIAPRNRRLTVTTIEAGGEGVRVGVADEGIGIAEDDLERVFEPFYTTKTQGLGLGLSVCRRIINAHGGRLWADSNGAGGATFFFTLPNIDGRRAT